MIALFMMSPGEMADAIKKNMREQRLILNLTQKTLSERSGVSFGVIKKFERTGKISLESLLKLALALGCLENFSHLFKAIPKEQALSLDDMLNQKHRKRGRE